MFHFNLKHLHSISFFLINIRKKTNTKNITLIIAHCSFVSQQSVPIVDPNKPKQMVGLSSFCFLIIFLLTFLL